MISVFKRDVRSMSAFTLKILLYILVFNVTALPVLLILGIPLKYAFSLILPYEGFFVLVIGVLFILCTFIYEENSIPYRWGCRTGWVDFKKFAKLKPEERQRYRQEGKILMALGLSLVLAKIILNLF